MGFFQQLLGQEGGPLIPGVDNPLQGGTILPGLGQLNIYNPNSVAGRAANDLAKDLGTGLEAIAKDPRKLAAVGIMIAFPGAASALGSYLLPAEVAAAYPTMAAIVGQTALNTATNGGDVKGAVTNALIQQGAPQLTKYVADTYATEGISKAVTDYAAKATLDVGIASALGQDPAAALMFGGVKAATSVVLDQGDIKNAIAYLPKEASSALKAAITAKVMNIDPSKAAAQDLINQAIGAAQGMVKASSYAEYHKLPKLTEEELSRISPDTGGNMGAVVGFVNDSYAKREGWDNNYEKTVAGLNGISDPEEFRNSSKSSVVGSGDFGGGVKGTLYSDGRIQPSGEHYRRLPTAEEAVTLKNVFGSLNKDVPQIISDLVPENKSKDEPTVGGLPVDGEKPITEEPAAPTGGLPSDSGKKLQEAQELGKSGDKLGQINSMREIVGLPIFNSIEEYNADQKAHGKEAEEPVVGALPTEPPTEPVDGLPTDVPQGKGVQGAQEPVGGLPTEPTLDNELEDLCAPGFHREGDLCVPDDDEPPESTDCPDGYVYDLDSKSCVPIDTTPVTKPPGTTPPTTKPPVTQPPVTQPPVTQPPVTQPPVTQTGGLPATAQQNPFTIPWLDTKPQMLEVKGGAKHSTSDQALRQLYDRVDPSLMDVFAERGFTPQGYSGGSSVTDVFSDFASNLEKGTPKFTPVRDPMLSTGARKAKQSGLSSATQLAQIKPGLTGNAKGGLPEKYAQAAPKGHNPEFITGLTGFYANGRGTGQSDDIPAMLHDGDYVMDADTVAALGDGSSKAGALSLADFQKQVPHEFKAGGNAVPAKIADGEYVFPEPLVTSLGGGDNKKGAQMLDAMREEIRSHKRSAPTSKIPPKAKSPLDYLKMVKG